MEEVEIWKSVGVYKGIDFTGYYEASNFGHIKSLSRRIKQSNNRERNIGERILKYSLNTQGYPIVNLWKDGKMISCLVHRIILQAFEPNPNPELYTDINHKDENPTNNCLNNLEWCTHEYNMSYGTRIERSSSTRRANFTPLIQLDFEGEIVNVYYSIKELDDTGVYKAWEPINKINSGKYIYKNYFWIKLDKYNEMTKRELLSLINKTRYEQRKLNKHKRFIVLLDSHGKFVKQFDTVKDATKFLGCSESTIFTHLRGKTKTETIHGYKCIYLEDYQNNIG